jgi:hypothetical protein
MDVLPAPVAPTIAIVLPAGTLKLTSLKTQSSSLYANQTFLNSILPVILLV